MGYKNSAGVKFNDSTDLIIRADENGTVESVFNRADSIEYIGEYAVPSNVTVSITNNAATTRALNMARVDTAGGIEGTSPAINSGQSANYNVLKNSIISMGSGTVWNIVSGDAEILPTTTLSRIKVLGNCVLTVEQP